jgi:hypothetical protein
MRFPQDLHVQFAIDVSFLIWPNLGWLGLVGGAWSLERTAPVIR